MKKEERFICYRLTTGYTLHYTVDLCSRMASWVTYLILGLTCCSLVLAKSNDVEKNDVDNDLAVESTETHVEARKIQEASIFKEPLKTLMNVIKSSRNDTPQIIARMLTRQLSSIDFPGDLLSSNNVGFFLLSTGAVIVGVAGIAVITTLILPFFGLRACNIFGTCAEQIAYAYSQPYAVSQSYDPSYAASGTFNQPSVAYGSRSYNKRSVEYLGPVLSALATAFEKYSTDTTTVQTKSRK